MILKSLKLKNFKCYTEKTYHFEQGITSICGENGSGKSSILEAISWILFNFLPYSASNRIIKKGAKTAEVELKIISDLDGDEYQLKRKTSGANCSVYNITKSYLVAEGVNNVQNWVRHQLNLTNTDNLISLCRNGIATPQGNLTIDFLETPENRRKIFDALLGLDEYKIMQNKIAESIKLLNEKTHKLQIDLAIGDGLEGEIKDLEIKIIQNKSELLEKQKLRIELENKLTDGKIELKKHKNNFDEYNTLSKEQERIIIEYAEIEIKLNKALQAEIEKEKLNSDTQKYLELKEEKKVLSEQKIELELQKNKMIQFEEILKSEKQNLQKAESEMEKLLLIKKEVLEKEKYSIEYKELLAKDKELQKQKTALETELNSKSSQTAELQNLNTEEENIQKSLIDLEEKKVLAENLILLEENLEKLRFEYNEIISLEKEKQKEKNKIEEFQIINLSNSVLESIKNITEQIIQIKKEIENKTSLIADLKAQIEVKQDLLPKLANAGICPILLEPCLNLEKKNNTELAVKSLEEELQESIKNCKVLKSEIENAQKFLEKLIILEKYLQKLNELEIKLSGRIAEEVLEKGKALKQEVEIARSAKSFLLNIPNLQKRLEQIQEKKENIILFLKDLESKTINLQQLQNTHIELENKLKELKPIADKVLIWKSELDKEPLISDLINKHKNKIIILSNDLEKFKLNIQKYIEVPEKLKKLESDLEQLEPLYIKWNQLSIEIAEIPSLKEKKENSTQKQIYNKNKLNELRSSGLVSEEWLIEKEKEIDNLQKQLTQKTAEEYSIKNNLSEAENKLAELKKKQIKFNEQKQELNKFQIQEKKLIKMRALYKELAIQLAKTYTQKIAQKATDLFREILQDSSHELNWTEDYQIIMYKNGQELPFELLSGGQQIAAAISVRLGLLQEMSNIHFAFFDEPTAHLDTDRRNQLALQIGSIKSFNQLFVITHDESFASQANHIINV